MLSACSADMQGQHTDNQAVARHKHMITVMIHTDHMNRQGAECSRLREDCKHYTILLCDKKLEFCQV